MKRACSVRRWEISVYEGIRVLARVARKARQDEFELSGPLGPCFQARDERPTRAGSDATAEWTGLPYACRYDLVFRILPRFAFLEKSRKPLTAMTIRVYGDLARAAHNPEVAGSNPVPAISISLLLPVGYDWLFSCAAAEILGLRLPEACLGVPVVARNPAS